jgi:hypothetical protein
MGNRWNRIMCGSPGNPVVDLISLSFSPPSFCPPHSLYICISIYVRVRARTAWACACVCVRALHGRVHARACV